MRTVVAAIRSVATFVGVSLYTLVLGPPCLLLALVFRWPGVLYLAGIPGIHLGLALAGIRYRTAGTEHIQRSRVAVYCVNHSSNVEPPVIFSALRELTPDLKILYKAELRKLPVLGRVLMPPFRAPASGSLFQRQPMFLLVQVPLFSLICLLWYLYRD